MRNLTESAKALRELLSQRILVLDGAMGTMLQQRHLTAEDFGGAALEGCNENLVRTRPDLAAALRRTTVELSGERVDARLNIPESQVSALLAKNGLLFKP